MPIQQIGKRYQQSLPYMRRMRMIFRMLARHVITRMARNMPVYCTFLAQLPEFRLVLLKLRIIHLLDVYELIARRARGLDELIELEVHGMRIPVLRILDEKNHEECKDGGAGIDIELP